MKNSSPEGLKIPLLTAGSLTPRIDHPGTSIIGTTGQQAIGDSRGENL